MIDTPLPRKLQSNVSVQQIGSETLVYDEIRHQAFCLNPTSAAVWKMCDGSHTVKAIAEATSLELQAPVSEALVHYAVSELRRDGLLEPESTTVFLPDASRRRLMRTLGAGAVAMLPVVAMVMAPTAAQAYNGCADCTAPSDKQKQAIIEAQKRAREQTDPFHLRSE